MRLLAGRTDVSVFGGLGGVGLIDELAMGAAGAVTGFSRLLHRRGVLDHAVARPPAPPVPDTLIPLVDEHLAAMARPVATDSEGAG